MKKKLLALLSLFLALVVFFSPCICSLDKVSAASLPSSFPLIIPDEYINYFEDIKQNAGMSNFSGEVSILITPLQNGGIRGIVLSVKDSFDLPAIQWVRDHGTCWVGDYALFSSPPTNLKNCVFDYHAYDPTVEQWGIVKWDNMQNYECIMGYVNNGTYVQNGTDHNFYYLLTFFNDFSPDYSGLLVGFPVSLQFNEQDFYNWIIDNNKLSELPSFITSSKLLSFLKFYKSFGSSNSSFLKNIASWFSYMNIGNQTNENIIILKNGIDKLYQEYINQYKHEFYSNSANQAHHRRNIQTQTDDDDLTLVTDDQTDDIYTKLLREIIRGIIALQVTVSEGHRAIIDTLNNLDFTVAVSNNGGDFHFPNLEELFTPTYSGFDDLEDQFFEKFPFLLDLKDLPEIEDYLEAQEQGDNLQVASLSAGPEAVEVDPLKTRDDLFRFTVPVNNNFMNGAVSGMSIDFASFTKFAPAIEALKGIISVIALFGFSHWLIKFAPKLLHGYASSD